MKIQAATGLRTTRASADLPFGIAGSRGPRQDAMVDNDLSALLRDHMATPFPGSVEKGIYYGRVDSVMIGADIFGWASRVAAGEELPEIDRGGLTKARDDLMASLPAFPLDARRYFEVVAQIATSALDG